MANSSAGGNEPTFEFPSWYKPRKRIQFGIRSLLLLTLLVGLLLSCVINLPAMIGWAYRHWQVGRKYDQCTFEGAQFSLRITAFHERGTFLAAPGAYYRYEVKRASDWRWRKILMMHVSADPIPRNQFYRLSDSCAYFFQDDLFGITRDGGSNWTFRGGYSGGFSFPQFSAQQLDPYAYIESIAINEDGTGTLRLLTYDYTAMKQLPDQVFETSDYGLTWREMQPEPP